MRLTFEVFGDVQIDRQLMRFVGNTTDLSPAFEKIGDSFLRSEVKQFNSQGAYASGGWAPLAASTIRRKARLKLDPRILHATLKMRKSLTIKGAPGQVRVITPNSITMGTAVKSAKGFPYPAAHQTGTRKMPRRRPVEIRSTLRTNWVKTLQRHMVEGVNL